MKVIKLGKSAPASIGEQEHAFAYICGAWEEGTQYRPGAMVTYADSGGGVSIYVAERATTQEPPHVDWFCMTKAAQGTPGEDAPLIAFEYSENGVDGWSSAWEGQKYLRVSNDGGDTWSLGYKFIGDDGDGAGDVRGPSEAVNERIVLFDGSSGKIVKDGGLSLSDLALTSHTHGGVYSPVDHNHDSNYAASSHNHDSDYADISHDHDSDYLPKSIWRSFGDVTATGTAGFSVEDTPVNAAVFAPGNPLRITKDADTYYAVVSSYSSGSVSIVCEDLTSSYVYGIEYAPPTYVVKIDVNTPGEFAVSATTEGLWEVTKDPLVWDLPPGRLVCIKHRIQTEDSAATTTQPKINVYVGTGTSSTTCTGSGTTYSLDAFVLPSTLSVMDGSTPIVEYTLDPVTGSLELDSSPSGAVTVSYSKWVAGDTFLDSDNETDTARQTATGNLDVDYGDRVELKIVKATGGTPGDDAEDLSVSLLFVLK